MPRGIIQTRFAGEANRGTLRSTEIEVGSDGNKGATFVSFPIAVTPARALTPALSVNYHAGQGNGVFGLGVDLGGLLNISRIGARKGVPRYDDSDIFMLSTAGELVKVSESQDKNVVQYRPRLDTRFADISFNKSTNSWVIRESNGVNHELGSDSSSQVLCKDKIYQWWVSKSSDARGNRIEYRYQSCSQEFLIDCINYGNYRLADQSEAYLFRCQFDYGDSDATQKTETGQPLWTRSTSIRPEEFTSNRAGFPVTIRRLCQRILLYHQVANSDGAGGVPGYLVKYWKLSYRPITGSSAVSVLEQFQEIGCRANSKGQYLTQALSPVVLDFFSLDTSFPAMQALSLDSLPGNAGDFQWVDLYRDGLPGVLYYDGTSAWYWRSEGNGTFSVPKQVASFPADMNFSSPGQCRVMHLGQENQTAFVIARGNQAGYYALYEQSLVDSNGVYQPKWDPYRPFKKFPTEFLSPLNEVMDLNGDGGNDLVVLNDMYPRYYRDSSVVGDGYLAYEPLLLPPDFPRHSLDATTLVTFADIMGDGLLHRVQVTREDVRIWPNLGNGRFDNKCAWPLPQIQGDFDPHRVFFVDIDGTGASDFVYVYPNRLDIYLNQGTRFQSTPLSFALPDTYTHEDRLLFGDMFGTGLPSVLFIKRDVNSVHYYTGRLATQKPYLLKQVTHSSGLVQTFNYESSTAAYLEDRQGSVTSNIRLPFAVPVLRETLTRDPVTQMSLRKTYRYHYGDYDFTERRFYGFAYVEERDEEFLSQGQTVSKPIQDRRVKSWFLNRASATQTDGSLRFL